MSFCVHSIRIFSKFSGDPYYEPLSWFMISYNTGKSALPDIYARCPSACVITNRYHFRHSEKSPKPEGKLLNSIYSVGCGF